MTPILLGAYAFCVLVAIGAAGLICVGFYIGALFFMGAFKAWSQTPVDDRPKTRKEFRLSPWTRNLLNLVLLSSALTTWVAICIVQHLDRLPAATGVAFLTGGWLRLGAPSMRRK